MSISKEESNSNSESTVERGNNVPIVASRYGFREELIDGKTYLMALTKEEYLETIKSDPNIPAEHLEDLLRRVRENVATCHLYSTMVCATPNNCQICEFTIVGTSYYCYCRNW